MEHVKKPRRGFCLYQFASLDAPCLCHHLLYRAPLGAERLFHRCTNVSIV